MCPDGMRLGLGTVCFGQHYGLSNRMGKTPYYEAEKILNIAKEAGIRTIDTAAHYGESEEVLGKLLPRNHDFEIVTKVPAFRKRRLDPEDGETLRKTFFTSLKRLCQDKVEALLLHNPDDLFLPGGRILYEVMYSLVNEKTVEKIGVSAYTKEQAEAVLTRYKVDLIQLPINIFDQRLLHSGTLAKIKSRNVEIHARSAFLQGLMLMDPGELDPYFNPIKPVLARFHRAFKEKCISPIQAALSFLSRIEEIDKIIIGVNTGDQLKANISDYNRAAQVDIDFSDFRVDDERMVNPTLWHLSSTHRKFGASR
jgi:aryl-alcohol dehydrogenase-like predicted oxidoreductase